MDISSEKNNPGISSVIPFSYFFRNSFMEFLSCLGNVSEILPNIRFTIYTGISSGNGVFLKISQGIPSNVP